MKLESHFLHLFASFQVHGYPATTLTMARTKQTKRKPVQNPRKQPKKDWGTAALMIQGPLPHLPPHPTQNRPDYTGMYTVINSCTVQCTMLIWLISL